MAILKALHHPLSIKQEPEVEKNIIGVKLL